MSNFYGNQLLHHLLEDQAAKSPEKTALEFHPNVRLTYRDLNEISNRLARYLKHHQSLGRDIVALCLEKSHVLIIAILAVLKADMAWVPLALDAPPARIKQILDACDVEFVLDSKSTRHIVGDLAPCVELNTILDSPELQSYPSSNLKESSRDATDLCHILFTSGSTGVPKGVMIEHRAVVHNVQELVKQFKLNDQTRTLQFAAPTFDIFGLDLFMTFLAGGCLVMAPISTIVEDITTFIHRAGITYVQLTPTIIQLIHSTGVPNLQILASSGEALSQDLANQWRKQVHLFNAYGPTETIVCTVQELSGNQIDAACIGQAVSGLDVCLFADGSSDEVGEGEIGEICVAGPQLFRGYLSTQTDMQSRDCNRNGERYYRTGDLGRIERDATGQKTLRYLGRRDGQVKVNGIRVDLGDIEQSILTCEMVRQCTVIQPRNGVSAGHLCSIIVIDPSFADQKSVLDQQSNSHDVQSLNLLIQTVHTSAEVLSALHEARDVATTRLPTHAIPSTWWAVKQMPLTSSGKIDRMKLRCWLEDMDAQTYLRHVESFCEPVEESKSPENDVEEQLRSLWAEVLGRPVSSISTAVSFIEIGANSLDVIRLISKARNVGLEFGLSEVYSAKTIKALSRIQIREDQNRQVLKNPSYRPFSSLPQAQQLAPFLEDAATACRVRVVDIEDAYPCTPYQAGLMTLDLKCPTTYVCAFSWTLLKNIEIDRFRAAWENVTETEPVLRNRLIWDSTAQDFWQVTVRYEGVNWSEEYFESSMALGDDLWRGFVHWDRDTERWKFHLKIHHSIIDGWSLRLMLNRVKSIYFSEDGHNDLGLPFAHFIRHRVEESCREESVCEKFWSQYLEGTSSQDFPPLPSDPHHEIHATERRSLKVPINLHDMATRYEVTPATFLYAAAGLVFGAHSDSEDVVFGLILAGRDAPLDNIFNMVGPAFATFPYRVRIDRNLALGLFLQSVQQQFLSIIPYQHYGLQRIKNCGVGSAVACEFRCLVVVQPEDENLAGEGLWETVHGQTSGLADSIPLSLELVLGENQVSINCNFDPAYISHDDVSILLSHLDCVLQDLSTSRNPGDLVSQVKLDKQDEQSQFLDWSQSYGSPVEKCLHELVQESVKRYPELIAIEDQATRQQFTYHELDTYSNRLSDFLQCHCKISPEVIIPMALEKSAVAIITILAILKTGAAYVPIDQSWPLERVRRILDETRATTILCSPSGAAKYHGLNQKVVEISESCWNESSDASNAVDDRLTSALPTGLAFVMYTSGSTGAPKGVMLEHRALSTSLTHLTRVFGLDPGTRHLQFSSFVYDVSVADIFISLLSGACICIPTDDNRLNRLSWTVKEMAIESAILTPSVVELISFQDAATLKALMTGGEMTRKSLIDSWAPRVRLFNAYGPTEASITTTVTKPLSTSADPTNIGLNVTAWHWIVRRDHTGAIYPAPMGCMGEIAIAGHSLARGYFNNTTLTQKHFVEVPQLAVGLIPSRIYLTGDIGKYQADGSLRIMGRKDRMIKVNGIRVEPGESEQQLRNIGGIFASCVVQCVYDHQSNAKLAAFIEVGSTTTDGLQLSGLIAVEKLTAAFKELSQIAQQRLKEFLPQQYVPTLFVPITRMPYTASDKADLKRLRDELQQVPNFTVCFGVNQETEEKSSGKAPTTPSEIALEAAFRQVFALKHRLTTSTNFFRQGGDSFAAIKLVSAARGHGFNITVQNVYRNPTLGDLATVATPVHKAPATTVRNETPPSQVPTISENLRAEIAQQCNLLANEIEDFYPASPFQEGLAAIAFADFGETDKEKNAYRANMKFQLAQKVDIARLTRALELVVARNPICRTKIVYSTERTMQVVQRSSSFHSVEYEAQEAENLFHYRIEQDEQRGLVRLALSIHHILYDAWTMNRLLEDINYNYNYPNSTRPGAQPYRRFIEYLLTLDSEAAGEYWTKQLNNAPLASFPLLPCIDHQARATKSTEHQTNLNLENIKDYGISAATVIASSMALLLSAYSNTDDVCYGTTLSGRDDPELENIAGPTLSTVPMRIQIHRDQNVAGLLRDTQESLLDMRQHQHYGLQNIARLPSEGAKHASQLRALLVIQQSLSAPGASRDDRIVQDLIPEETSMYVNYPLVVIAEIDASTGDVALRVEYDSECLGDIQARRLIQHLGQIMTQCTDLDRLVSDIDAITDIDRAEIMKWNPTPPPASSRSILEIFKEIVDKQPHHLAIESKFMENGDLQQLSYSQLDEFSTRLCNHIYPRIPSSWVIGVCLSKSPLMVIAILAIWKAGRAFVTLDPSAPVTRLNAMLAELGQDILILTEISQAHLFRSSAIITLDPSLPTLFRETVLNETCDQLSQKEEHPKVSEVAYIFYTSGSSGTPKGVIINHSAIATSLLDITSVMELGQGTRMLQFAAFTFDTSILEVFGTLIRGGCICMPSESQRLATELASTVKQLRVSHLILTPTVAQFLEPNELSTVQDLMLVGEPPSRHFLETWKAKKPQLRIMNGYGPTEASVHSSTNKMLCGEDPHNIGQATACNLFITVPNDVNKLAAIGTIGELVICGNTLADGYLNNPALTSQVFGANPTWISRPNDADVRYYKTGDLARYATDGSIIYLGRKDLQVKIHGQRLELLDVEWQIRQYGKFSGCVVDVISSDLLVAFVIIDPHQKGPYEGPLPPETLSQDISTGLHTYLRSVLPAFMVPVVYVPVDCWPTTTSGKVDRQRLRTSVEPIIDSYRCRHNDSKRLPQTSSQKLLAKVWAEAIPVSEDQIGIDDTLFSLGGDSITVIRIIAGLRRQNLNLDLAKAYHHHTLEAMAGSLKGSQSTKDSSALPPLPFSLIDDLNLDICIATAAEKCHVSKEMISDIYPCTSMQEALMVSSTKSQGAFFNQEIFQLNGDTSISRLVTSLQMVWARHDILRTRIILDEGYHSLQVVIDEALNVILLEGQDLENYLQQDASMSPGYGDGLSRCAIITCGSQSYLIVSQHHAVFDGWSANLLMAEIRREYSTMSISKSPLGFFSSFVRNVIDVRQSSEAEHYWRQHFADLTETQLPQMKSSPTFEANRKYTLKVPTLSSSKHSLATIAEAAWGVLLGRFTETEDVSFGTVRSGRTALVNGIDSILGPTIVTIPRRLRPIRDKPVSEYLQQVEVSIMQALPWEQFGHQNIRKLSDAAHLACKFGSIIVVQMAPPSLQEADTGIFSPISSPNDGLLQHGCLTVECQPQESGEMLISFTYDDRIISTDDVRWMANQFLVLLTEIVDKSNINIQDLNMVGPDGMKQIQQWNNMPIVPCEKRVDELFVERAEEWPTLTAIKACDATLSYKELDELSSRLAVRLQMIGISETDIVPLYMTKSAAMIVAMLATLKAGAAYTPLATDSPQERLCLLLDKVSAKIVLCTPDQEKKLESIQVESICCDIDELRADPPKSFPPIKATASHLQSGSSKDAVTHRLAYIIFTSGSSGEPKGVLIDHTALATTILGNGRYLGYVKGTRTLSFAAYTFDVNVMEVYLTLLHGGCLFIPSEEQRLANLCSYINDNEIELAFMTPTAIRNLLLSPSHVPSLKTLRAGGEPLPQTLLQLWSRELRLINSYGPTEACVDACRNPHVTPDTDPNNIGYPIGTHLWVVEPGNHRQLAPIGCAGELLISGPTLARGYLNDEEKTRKAFIDGSAFPWILPGEERLYTTGDIVRQASDGSINFIGRRDLQTKLNGFRIELEEIEYVIECCEGITAAVVDKVSLPENGSEVLVAFFTVTTVTSIEAEGKLLAPTDQLHSLIRNVCDKVPRSLPPYMIPKFYLPIDRIPLTLNGKVDRKVLRRIFDECSRDKIAFYKSGPIQKRETRTTIQKILQGLWAQVLSLDPSQIGLDSEFVSLGGESLAAIKLATMCREVGFNLNIADILRTSILEDMAGLVERNRNNPLNTNSLAKGPAPKVLASNLSVDSHWSSDETAQIAEVCGLDVAAIEDIYPCTPIQEALMAVTARVPDAYIARDIFQLPSGIDLIRFRSAWELVSDNNSILRTRICSIVTKRGVENIQVVCKHNCDWTETYDGSLFDAKMGMGTPLIRFGISKNSDGLVFEVLKHHAIYDGFSGKLLWDDFHYAFTNLARPQPRPPYRQYVDYLQSLEKEETVRFWKQYLEGFQGDHFPTLPSAEYIPRTTSKSCHTIEKVVSWNSSSPFTFATVARAAWALILSMRSRVSGSAKDVCFAATLSGRSAPLPDLEDMTGPTITTVPIRVQLDIDQSIHEYLQQIQEQVISMLPFEHCGIGQIQAISDAARVACKTPNLLVVQPSQLQEDALPLGLTRLADDGEGMVEPFGLVIECMQNNTQDSIALSASYDPLLIAELEVRHMLQQLFWVVKELNNRSLDSSSLRSILWGLGENDDFQRMVEWNKTPQASPSVCLHELVEESARRHPNHLAIDAHDGKHTYEQLNEAANKLATILQKDFDIKPGDLVPLCFEKSSFMIIAMLGVLKAGAGYVPLDISHPSSRIEYILREIKARLVIVSPLQAAGLSFPMPTLTLDSKLLLTPLDSFGSQLATPRDVAYVTFTSGSSGPPKGVITEHRACALSVLEHGKRYQHDRSGTKLRSLQFSSYTFDASVLDIFATMAYGGCVCIPSEQDRMGNLEDVLIGMEINFADLTPTVANLLEPSRIPMLKGLAIGGEMANRALVKKWTSANSPLEHFINSYGPTEVAIGCAVGKVSLKKPVGHVGKRVGGSLWIVDEANHNHLVPITCVGELVVSGDTLARGYLNDSERTRAAFIEHVPWLARIGEERMYKTGDLARFDVNGNVEILGRKDDGQIKLHGLRLELGEIEAAIEACQCLSAVHHVAAAKVNIGENPTLVAFIQLPDENSQVSATLPDSILSQPSERIRTVANNAEDLLRKNLPEYMIPRLWVPVSSWPLNASGKTDRKRLISACEALTAVLITEYQRPCVTPSNDIEPTTMTETEKIIAETWKQALKKETEVQIWPHDDFFKLGGDSLSTIMLISALRAKKLSITAQEIFMTKSLRNMAQIIDSKILADKSTREVIAESSRKQDNNDETGSDTTIPSTEQFSLVSEFVGSESNMDSREIPSTLIGQNDIEEVFPASHTQLAFLIEGQKWCRAYYAWSFIEVGISTPIAQVHDACNAVTQHHPILRTSFHLVGRQCYQAIRKQVCDFKILFFSGFPDQMCTQLDTDVENPVYFEGVLTRFRLLIDRDSGRQILALGLSHAQYDGFCLPTILNDLRLANMAKLTGGQTSPSYHHFIDYSLKLCNESTDCFWREMLKGSRMTSIVRETSDSRPVMNKSIKRAIPFDFKHSGNISYVAMLKAAWSLILSRLSQTTDITFGNVVSGRFAGFEGAQDIVGPCLNFIPARIRIATDQSFSDLVNQIYEQQVATIPYESTPFDHVARQASWPASTRFASIFQFQNIPDNENELYNDPIWPVAGNAVYGGGLLQNGACWLMAWPSANGEAAFRFTFSEETLSLSRAESILELLFNTLNTINDNLDCKVSLALSQPIDESILDKDAHLPPSQNLIQPHLSHSQPIPLFCRPIIECLEAVWKEIIPESLSETSDIDQNDSFFDLGGDSISAAQLALLCKKAGFDLKMQDIIDFPTLKLQALLLSGNIKPPVREIPKLFFSHDHKFN